MPPMKKLTVMFAVLLGFVGCVQGSAAPRSDRIDLSCLSGPTATAIAIENGGRDTDRLRPCA